MSTSAATNGVTSIRVKPAKKADVPKEQEIYEFTKTVVPLTLVGTSQLIVNNFSTKSIIEMEDNRRMTADQKRELKKTAKPPVVPEERWQAARILDEKGRDCFPARYIKAALVTCAIGYRYPDVTLTTSQVKGQVYVLGDLLPIKHSRKLPVMRRDVVRVGKFPNKQPDLRYRPGYDDWSLDIKLEFEPNAISLSALYHLIRRAGMSVGLGEWRPEKSPAGIYGRFDIQGVRG